MPGGFALSSQAMILPVFGTHALAKHRSSHSQSLFATQGPGVGAGVGAGVVADAVVEGSGLMGRVSGVVLLQARKATTTIEKARMFTPPRRG